MYHCENTNKSPSPRLNTQTNTSTPMSVKRHNAFQCKWSCCPLKLLTRSCSTADPETRSLDSKTRRSASKTWRPASKTQRLALKLIASELCLEELLLRSSALKNHCYGALPRRLNDLPRRFEDPPWRFDLRPSTLRPTDISTLRTSTFGLHVWMMGTASQKRFFLRRNSTMITPKHEYLQI